MSAIPIQSYSDVLESIDGSRFAEMITEQSQDLREQMVLELQKVDIRKVDGEYARLSEVPLAKVQRAQRNIAVIKTKLERLREMNGVVRDIFMLEYRLKRLTGMRLPIINLLVECAFLSLHFHRTESIKGDMIESHYRDPKGVPFRLRVLSRPELISLNVATSDCVRNILAERARNGLDLQARFTPDETGILNTGLMLKYYSLFM